MILILMVKRQIDYYKMMNIVLSEGYSGYVGIEYEGDH